MMNMQINQLVKTLLQKDSLEQCSLQELEQFADRHPYFGAAQLLLTKKLQTENPDRYDEQLQKTFLFFHNPLWVEHLLNETGGAEIITPEKKEDKEELTPAVELAPESVVVDQIEITDTTSLENNEAKEVPFIIEITPDLVVEPTSKDTGIADETGIVLDPSGIENKQDPTDKSTVPESGMPEVTEIVLDPAFIENNQDLVDEPISQEIVMPEAMAIVLEAPVIGQVEVPVLPPVENKDEEDVKIITESKQDQEAEVTFPGTVPTPVGLISETEQPPVDIPGVKNKLAGQQLAGLKKPENPVKDELIFEPFHTVDYFASQGIKVKEEEKPIDNFGKQLKSFTDWLKTMKRLSVSEIAKQVETKSAENVQKVEQLAAHSLQDREILTEAMAEVWEKQGNINKAIELYSKLSLLDPSKNRYFAAKIEELKKTN